MSYSKAMKWSRKHPKGTKQPLIFSTGGFWPSHTWMKEDWFPYREECAKIGVKPISLEAFYHHYVTTKIHRFPSDYAAMTKAGNL